MYFDAAGNLLACADEKTELWSIRPDGTHAALVREYGGTDRQTLFITATKGLYAIPLRVKGANPAK